MEARRKYYTLEPEYTNYNMNIDSIQQYLYFDPDWNISEVLHKYRLKTIFAYCRRIIWKSLPLLIKQHR